MRVQGSESARRVTVREKKNDKSKDYCKGDRYFRYFIYLPHDYNNYNKMPKKKCRKRWRGGLKETIELMLIRPPQLQFLEGGIKITATDTI